MAPMDYIHRIVSQVSDGERITPDDALSLMRSRDIHRVGRAAHLVRQRKHPENVVSFLIDRNINYTNVCVARCTFCNFYRKPGHEEGYILPKSEIFKKIEETEAIGGTGILMQGGMHPKLKIDYYEDLLSSIRERYSDWRIDELWFGTAQEAARFLHALPVRRGMGVTDDILDGPQSGAWT